MQLKPSRRTLEITATSFALVILALNIAFKFSATTALRSIHRRTDATTLEGPNTLWSLDTKEVAMYAGSWNRYSLRDAEHWAPLFPDSGAVYLGPDHTRYTIAMMHQLQCLDVIREQFTLHRGERDLPRAHHCLNYLRQSVMCRGDLQIDGMQYASRVHTVAKFPVRRCRDWRVVYDKVLENQREHVVWTERVGGNRTGF